MLHCSITIFTFLSLLGHALFGCCWHHGHPPEVCAAEHVESDRSETHEKHHHCHKKQTKHGQTESKRTQIEEENRTGDFCGEENCKYIVSFKQNTKSLFEYDSVTITSACLTSPTTLVDPLSGIHQQWRDLTGGSAPVIRALATEVQVI